MPRAARGGPADLDPLRRELLHLVRRSVHHVGRPLQRLADHDDLLLSLRPVPLLDGFSHAGERLHTVPRVEARGVDGVAVPGAAWEAGGGPPDALALDPRDGPG